MRRRLLLSSLTISIACVLVLCLPLGWLANTLIRQDFDHRLDRNLQNIAAAIVDLGAQGRPIDSASLTSLVPADRRAVYTPDRGAAISAGHTAGSVKTAEIALPTGRLELQAPLSLLDDRLERIWLLIAALAILAIAVAAGLSLMAATRISRPLQALANTAEKLGRGDLRPSGARYRISELDQLAEVLDNSAENLAAMIDDERRFVREASHQLRTPLTSLSVRLEEIRSASSDPGVRAEADAGLQQIERLTEVVTGLLVRGRRMTSSPRPVGLMGLLEAQEREWQPAFRRVGRHLIIDSAVDISVVVTQVGLEQAISTLLENALTHGQGETTVTVRPLGAHVAIDVADGGPGVPDELGQRIFLRDVSGGSGTGLGLALARSIIEADGGRLELTRQRPARFTIFLPTKPSAAAPTARVGRPQVSRSQSQVNDR